MSSAVFPIGDEQEEIEQEAGAAGYDEAIAVYRDSYREYAETLESFSALRRYWSEYLKERLSALAGRISGIERGDLDMLSGKFPDFSAYRSAFIDDLRARAARGELPTNPDIRSPQIEPTIKRHLEWGDRELGLRNKRKMDSAFVRIASAKGYSIDPVYAKQESAERYALIPQELMRWLSPLGFNLTRSSSVGCVLEFVHRDSEWKFFVTENSRRDFRKNWSFAQILVRAGFTRVGCSIKPEREYDTGILVVPVSDIVPCARQAFSVSNTSFPEISISAGLQGCIAASFMRRLIPIVAGLQLS